MGSEKTSEGSSDQETDRSSSKDGVGRLYECIFCKRGFTNAQALGGHMNIHRKDKVKAKHQKPFTTAIAAASTTKSNKDHDLIGSSESLKIILNEESNYLGSCFGSRTDDNHGYQFTPSNPNFPWNLAASQYDNHVVHEERLSVNLNIGIGVSGMRNNILRNTMAAQENEVDLELRLGH